MPYRLAFSLTLNAAVICPDVLRVVHVRRVRLRRQDRELQRDQRRVGRLQSAVDLLVEIDVLLVVVEPQAGQQSQAVA